MPSSTKTLKNGDIISIDIGVYYKRFHGDAARTHAVGEISDIHKKLIAATENSFFKGMKYAKENNRLYEISSAIHDHIDSQGFSVVTEWCGHGIGQELHEDPQIPHTRQTKRGVRLQRGMTLAIEPMINEGTHEVKTLSDTWTVVTKDGKFSAHYENTVLITDGEPDILTVL